MKPLRVQRYEEILIYARGNEKLPQICDKNDQIKGGITDNGQSRNARTRRNGRERDELICLYPSHTRERSKSKNKAQRIKTKKIAKRMAYACICHFFFVTLQPV